MVLQVKKPATPQRDIGSSKWLGKDFFPRGGERRDFMKKGRRKGNLRPVKPLLPGFG